MFKDLQTCNHVFVRQDAVRRPLQPPYNGPYLVVERKDNTFKILVKGKPVWVTINRLKPAFIFSNALKDVPSPLKEDPMTATKETVPVKSRYGRTVKFKLDPTHLK